jgi:hypothetical protein
MTVAVVALLLLLLLLLPLRGARLHLQRRLNLNPDGGLH